MIETAFQYHLETSYRRDQMSGHYLDWTNQPTVFKDYHGLQPKILPRDFNLPQTFLYDLLGAESRSGETGGSVHIATLSQILYLTYSLTAQARHSGGDFYFRSAASAGALYPTEIYLTSCNVEGLEDGLYHFAIHRHCLGGVFFTS